MNKTFQDIINDGYTFPEIVDEPTQKIIIDWFKYREVADNIKFVDWFNRSLMLNYPYYRQLMRIDPTVSNFDWLIENYSERQNSIDKNNTNSNTQTITGNDTTTGSGKINTVHDNTVNSDLSETGKIQGYDRNTGLSRIAPMSQEYTDTQMSERNSDEITAGNLSIDGYSKNHPRVNITNPTQTQDTLTETGNVNQTNNNQLTKDNGKATTDTTNSTTNTKNQTLTNNNTNASKELIQEISSGRNVSISELLEGAKRCILGSRAWLYLYKNLDMCFLQVYESEE